MCVDEHHVVACGFEVLPQTFLRRRPTPMVATDDDQRPSFERHRSRTPFVTAQIDARTGFDAFGAELFNELFGLNR